MLHRLPITAHSAARRFATSSSAAAMAHVTRVTAGNQAAFDAAIKEHAGQEDVKVVALFTGASDASGVSWCPDCNDAKPAIEAALAKADGPTVFITVPLVRDEYKGNASHWARTHPSVKLQRIPTLFRWASNGKRPANALIEDQCKVARDVQELVNGDE